MNRQASKVCVLSFLALVLVGVAGATENVIDDATHTHVVMAGAVSRPARTHALSRSVDTVALRTEVENSWLASHSFAAKMNEGETIELRAGGFTKTCIKKGNGVRPEDGNLCTMNYTGKLDDGTVFDSSVGKRRHSSFILA